MPFELLMQCRANCGACCIAISIERPFYGMPNGKPAGVRCVHLSPQMVCGVFDDSRRPALCGMFKPEPEYCGDNREQAMLILAQLETQTAPGATVVGVTQ